jgi:hypothetical protein
MKFNLWKLDEHSELVEALFAAHREAAIANDNASKLCVQQAWGGSGRFENAIIAGMATIGALHAPLRAARELWEHGEPPSRVDKWPGFGNSFWSAGDPAFRRVDSALRHDSWDGRYVAEVCRLIDLCAKFECATGCDSDEVAPNAALYTAIVASICEVPRGLESALFALARIPAWAEMCGAVQHPVVGGVR